MAVRPGALRAVRTVDRPRPAHIGRADLVVDLSGVSLIDSSGLGALVNIYKEVHAGAGR